MKNKVLSHFGLALCIFSLAAWSPAAFAEEAKGSKESKGSMMEESKGSMMGESKGSMMEGSKDSMMEESKGLMMGESKDAMAPMMDEAMMAKMQEYSTPNENHRALDAFVGEWEAAAKMWMDPSGEPMVSQGSMSTQWILDGHFIQQKYQGTMMDKPFEGIAIIGYDNIKKTYQSLWIDGMATGMTKGEVRYDPAAKTFVEEGQMSCPEIGGDRSYRGKITLIDNDHYTHEFFMQDKDGREFRHMEISYTRVK